jgi:SHS2 domain-containing protein
MVVALAQVQATVSREVTVIGQDLVALLVSWLNELIFLFDTDYLLPTYLEITSLPETSSGCSCRPGLRAKCMMPRAMS